MDDRADERASLVDFLVALGVPRSHVAEAACAEDAQRVLAGQPGFDVLVSDHRMPGMRGTQLLAWARLQSPRTIRVLVTGWDERLVGYDAFTAGGADAVLAKPVDPARLEAALRLALDARHPPARRWLLGRARV
ncbi:MAG TPA: response regulator [Candidatus Thermoplasmatota archaeon]|nr:response regulator [Candidatus Thermoplasmatota archaeon]